MITEETERIVQDTVNKISLIAAVIVFFTWSLISIFRSKLLNRVTLRFQIIIAFIDILRHVSSYFIRVENDTLCGIMATSVNLSDQLYIEFNTLLAINTYLVFISRQRPKMIFYPLYVFVSVLYTGILNLCYYVNGSYGRNQYGDCFFKPSENAIDSRIYMMYLMDIPGVLICGYVTLLVLYKFKERMSKLRITRGNMYTALQDEESKPLNHLGKLYWRVSMYPISCFITIFPFIIAMILYDIGLEPPLWYVFLYRFCRRLPGITNFFFMLYDPNFHFAIKEFYKRAKNRATKKHDDNLYELEEPNQATQPEEGTWLDMFRSNEAWEIEFDDGYKMPVQDHIKYL